MEVMIQNYVKVKTWDVSESTSDIRLIYKGDRQKDGTQYKINSYYMQTITYRARSNCTRDPVSFKGRHAAMLATLVCSCSANGGEKQMWNSNQSIPAEITGCLKRLKTVCFSTTSIHSRDPPTAYCSLQKALNITSCFYWKPEVTVKGLPKAAISLWRACRQCAQPAWPLGGL